MRKYDEAAKEDAFLAEIRTTVTDSKGYLGRAGESGKVKLTIKRSDSMEMPSYDEVYKELELELVKQEDGTLTLDQVDVLASLPANSGWQITLHTTYKGSPVTLDTITFRTDADYVTVSNHRELLQWRKDKTKMPTFWWSATLYRIKTLPSGGLAAPSTSRVMWSHVPLRTHITS